MRTERSWAEHHALVEAIADRDPERAAEIMQRHVDRTKTVYRAHMETQGEFGDDAAATP